MFEDIVLNKWHSINEILKNKKEAEGNIINKLRELKQVELIEGTNDSFKPVEAALKAYRETEILKYINSVLKYNSIVKTVINHIYKKGVLSVDELEDILKNEMPFIDAQDSTWLFYARVFGSWLNISNIANYKDGELLPPKPGEKSKKYLHEKNFIPSIQINQLEKFIEALYIANAPQNVNHLAKSLGRKSFNGAASDSQFLGLIVSKSRKSYSLSENGKLFNNMNKDERKKYVYNKLIALEYVTSYINDIENGISPKEAFGKVLITLGINDINETTRRWRNRLLRNWLIYCEVIKKNTRKKV